MYDNRCQKEMSKDGAEEAITDEKLKYSGRKAAPPSLTLPARVNQRRGWDINTRFEWQVKDISSAGG